MNSHRIPRRKNRIAGQFSARTIEMMEAPAFQVLSLTGHRILDRIEIEHAHHGGNDNGKLPVTFDQFVEYGIHRHTVAPALREVCALGFVEPGRCSQSSSSPSNPDHSARQFCDARKSTPTLTEIIDLVKKELTQLQRERRA
jgi:hypothetical protein